MKTLSWLNSQLPRGFVISRNNAGTGLDVWYPTASDPFSLHCTGARDIRDAMAAIEHIEYWRNGCDVGVASD